MKITYIQYPEDCLKIQKYLLLNNLYININDISILWSYYSDDNCARWIFVNDEDLDNFKKYIYEHYRGDIS